MPKPEDVKPDQASSAGKDVKEAAPSPATDVTASAPSTEKPEKPHEQSVPYDRFSEKVEEVNRLKAELESMKTTPPPPEPAEPFNWGFDVPTNQPSSQPSQSAQLQSPYDPDEIERRLAEDIQSKPFSALWPMMLEAARQQVVAQKKLESQVRGIPDFNDYESDYYTIPDNLIQQTQQNPEIVRYLLAKHRRTLTGKKAAPSVSTTAAPPPTNGPSTPPASMEDLAEKYRKEGEARALERINAQRGMTSESTATYTGEASDEPELDEQGKMLMAKMGLSPDQMKKAAARLDNFMKGK